MSPGAGGDPDPLFRPRPPDPALTAAAKAVEADYPEYEVIVHFGFLYRAQIRGSMSPLHVEASSESELRSALDTDRGMRELARRGRNAAGSF